MDSKSNIHTMFATNYPGLLVQGMEFNTTKEKLSKLVAHHFGHEYFDIKIDSFSII